MKVALARSPTADPAPVVALKRCPPTECPPLIGGLVWSEKVYILMRLPAAMGKGTAVTVPSCTQVAAYFPQPVLVGVLEITS